MIFNVAQLMKEPVGSGASTEADILEEKVQLDEDLKVLGPINGHVRMRRIKQGLLVDGGVDLVLGMECARCLKEFELPTHITFAERFNPTVDVMTGTPLPRIEEDDVFAIDEHHQVDLTEAIRQAVLLAVPLVPLCKEDCAGLCGQCGQDLNLGHCNCQPVEIDSRLDVLKQLLQNEQLS
jgi:uncharacterized protein